MNGHTKHNRNKAIAEHFNKPDYLLENLRLAVVKKIRSTTKQKQKVEEKIIFKFECINKGIKRLLIHVPLSVMSILNKHLVVQNLKIA